MSRYRSLALICVLVGIFFRVWHFERIAIDHFDEGVYSSNIWFAGSEAQYPMRHLYAPPLLPFLIEMLQLVLGPTTLASVLPSLIAGCLTIVLVWRTLSSWFGPDAALAGVWLAALSDVHQVYSRMALTDVMLGLFLLLAVKWGVDAVLKGGFVRCMAAGVATGLAWWTKYNGWLALAILVSGSIAWIAIHRPDRHQQGNRTKLTSWRIALRLLLICGVAIAIWWPVVMGLQKVGGYAAVAANHKTYMQPLSQAPDTLLRQLNNHRVLEGPLTWISVVLAMCMAGLFSGSVKSRFTWNHLRPAALASAISGLLVIAAAATFISVFGALLVVAVVGLLGSLKWPVDDSSETRISANPESAASIEQRNRQCLAAWILLAWLIGLLVATPFYRPYPRLTLPWMIAVWLGASIAIAWWFRAIRNAATTSQMATNTRHSKMWKAVAICGLAGTVLFFRWQSPASRPQMRVTAWENRTQLSSFVGSPELKSLTTTDGKRTPIFTFSEPALNHVLNSRELASFPTTTTRPTAMGEAFLLVGEEGRRSEEFQSWNQRSGSPILEHAFAPSTVVRLNEPLDQQQMNELLSGAKLPDWKIQLFPIHP